MNYSDKRVSEVWSSFLDELGLADPFRLKEPEKTLFLVHSYTTPF